MFGFALTDHQDPKKDLVCKGDRYNQRREATEFLAAGHRIFAVQDDDLDNPL